MLAYAIASGFHGCIWDGSPGGAAQKLRIPKIQFAKHMKIKKKEDQSVDTLLLLRMGNKIHMEGVTETKFRAETDGRTIQTLPHPSHKHPPIP